MRLRITHGNGPWESEFPELTADKLFKKIAALQPGENCVTNHTGSYIGNSQDTPCSHHVCLAHWWRGDSWPTLHYEVI
jgi:hypothetical protein